MASVIVSPDKITIYQTDIAEQESSIQKKLKPGHFKYPFPVPYLFKIPDKSDMDDIYIKTLKEKKKSKPLSIFERNVYIKIPLLKYSSKINLNLLPDLHLTASLIRIDYRSEDDFTWFGTLSKDNDIDLIITVKGQSVRGNINVGNKTYNIRPVSPPLHQLLLVDYSKLPDHHYPLINKKNLQKDLNKDLLYERGDDGSNIHVMVLYTPKAAEITGNINTLIQLAVDETNISYENSNINTRLNIVHTHMVDYQEGNIVTDLDNLSSQHDGYMDEIHELRDQYCADIVVLIAALDNYCGISYLNADSEHAFCIVSNECATGYYSFAHEIGHLFGARHNPEHDPKKLPYPYGHGYLHTNGWRTIMSYNNFQLCPGGSCQRILYWSNPGIRYKNIYLGTFSTHNNARLLNESSIILANFRSFGKGFTINNNGNKKISITSIYPENEWVEIVQSQETPFDIDPTQSKSIKVKINWQDIKKIEKSYIWVKTIEKNHPVQVIAIPSNSAPILSVTPTEISCNKYLSMQTITVDNRNFDNKDIKWRAFSLHPWLTIIDGYNGSGKGTVSLRIEKNLMGKRSGALTISSIGAKGIHKTVIVNQSGNSILVKTPAKIKENETTLHKAGIISVPYKLTKPLKIELSTSNDKKIKVPDSVIIQERNSNAFFDIKTFDNNEPDGPQKIFIKAKATGWFSGEAQINVLDNDGKGGIIIVGPEEAYKSIQEAIDDAAPDSSILVKSGHYTENLVLNKKLSIISEIDATQTFIHAKYPKKNAIEIHKSNTILDGFSIEGSKYYAQAAIFIAKTASNCLIKNNICGIDDRKNNYYGIYIDNSNNHTLSGNICQFNSKDGIYLDQSNNNMLFNNICKSNKKTGIFILNSQKNTLCMNKLKNHTEYGLYLMQNSAHNQLYLNAFINNRKANIYSKSLTNFWQNSLPINFHFNQKTFSGFLGNYYDDHLLEDKNENGITDTFYILPGEEPPDEYPLSSLPDKYEISTLFVDKELSLCKNKMGKMQNKCFLPSGKSLIFKSSIETDLTWDMTDRDAWTGSIKLLQTFHEKHLFQLEVGVTDETDLFTTMGKPYDIINYGIRQHLHFCFFPGVFSTPPGHWISFKLTNSSPEDYTILLGGGNTYISPYKHTSENFKEWVVGPDNVFRSIQSALNFSEKGYTIIVNPGEYVENINISKSTSLISERGYTHTVISAKKPGKNTIHITADNVLVKGFTVFGSNRSNAAGICVYKGVANCQIENNRCGYDHIHTNDIGIFIQSSMENNIVNNRCIANEKHGIWVNNSFMNNFSQNLCYRNQSCGIFINDSLYNKFKHNTFENNDLRGINIINSSRNILQYNIIDSNKKDGLYIDTESTKNLIFLNNFVLNLRHNVDSYGTNRWYSSYEHIYKYQGNIYTGYLGNYYSDNNALDNFENGKSVTLYDNNGADQADYHPLIKPFIAYEIINNDQPEPVLITQKQTSAESKSISPKNNINIVKNTQKTTISELNQNTETKTLDTSLTEKAEIEPIENIEHQIAKAQPILIFTDIPSYGNRLKNLHGMLINAPYDKYYIAVYIYIRDTGWRSKPYKQSHIIEISKNGQWECDITTAPFDQNAIEILALLFNKDELAPILNDAPVLPDSLLEKAMAVVRVSRDE